LVIAILGLVRVSALSGCGLVDVGAELLQAESHAAFDRSGR
jgi:hypothetical protein